MTSIDPIGLPEVPADLKDLSAVLQEYARQAVKADRERLASSFEQELRSRLVYFDQHGIKISKYFLGYFQACQKWLAAIRGASA